LSLDNSILFDSLINYISDGLYIIDKDMRIVFINDKAKEIMEIDKDDSEIIGKYCHDFSQGKWCGGTGSVCETLRSGNEFKNVEIKLELESGKCKILKQNTKKVYDDKGEFVGAAALIFDNTKISCLKAHLKAKDSFQNIIGKNYQMLDMYDSIRQVAKTDASVLILGESGTGKELVADAVHNLSKRKNGPLIKVNCSALSENILESELFGHVKGSFTGAIRDKVGKFELANNGTILLDEIGELDPKIQIKLLRVLQEKEIEKVGGTRTIKVNVRIIAATNADLKKKVQEKNFREDLYYRLNVYPIKVIPLRERLDDIELLTKYLLERSLSLNDKPGLYLDELVKKLFKSYSWPGNIRELEHAIEYAVIRAKNDLISINELPPDLKEVSAKILMPNILLEEPEIHVDLEEQEVKEALLAAGWNKSKAAKKLKVGRTTLWRLMKKYYIEDPSKR